MSIAELKERYAALPRWKRVLGPVVLLAPPVLMVAFVTWFMGLHGSRGFFAVVSNLRYAVYVLLALSFIAPLLAVLWMIARRKGSIARRKGLAKSVALVTWLLVAICIIVPVTGFTRFSLLSNMRSGDKPPQLLVADGTGSHGVPDMAVVFWTERPTANTLRWGREETGREVNEKAESREHAFMLNNLLPGESYWYRLNGGRTYGFTAPPAGGSLRFAVSSDPHFGAGTNRADQTDRIMKQVSDPARGFQMFFMLGDGPDLGFDDGDWRQMFDAMSPHTSAMPTRPIAGNHDSLAGGVKLYLDYLYPRGMRLQSGSRLWYRVDVGTVHFLMMDLEWGTDTYSDAQREWFERELTRVPRDEWCIVMSHCFYYSSGGKTAGWGWYDDKDMIGTFAPLFEKYGVDLVFSGHDHHMELLEKNGVTYTVIGTLGGKLDPERTYTSPASRWYRSGQFGFLDVAVTGDTAKLTFRDPGFRELKSATVSKVRGR